jgi:putative DNA primase/helicase
MDVNSDSSKPAELDWKVLSEAATGKWAHIFEDLAPELNLAIASAPYHVPCPVHGGENGFRLFDHFNETGRAICNTCGPIKSGFHMLRWLKNISLEEAKQSVADWLGVEKTRVDVVRKPYVPLPKVDPAVAYARIRDVWKATTDVRGSVAETYLAKRGIWTANQPTVLRAHPGLGYVHGKERKYYGKFPCLIAPVRNIRNEIVSLHRIFLSDEGDKAPVPDAKKMMSQCSELQGSAIRLFPAKGDVLGVAEGIETALAVHAITRMPVWSCVSAVLLELVHIPANIKHVVIWADLDKSGRGIQAAERLADRLEKEGLTVEIYLPPCAIPDDSKGVDWLDVLLKVGLNGFPAKWRRWRPGMTRP